MIWKSTSRPEGGSNYHDFRVIHQKKCDQDPDFFKSKALPELLGPDGLAYLTSWLSVGPLLPGHEERPRIAPNDMPEFVDLFRRLQLPGYEEARRRFSLDHVQQEYQGATEFRPYMQDALDWIGQQPLN